MSLSPFLQEATARGFVFQCTDTEALDSALRGGVVSAYIGFDCTADSLHIGNLVGIMILRLLQKHGHRPVPLIGGGTTRIGDPSGKDESRQLLTDAQIAANAAGIRRCFDPFLRFGAGPTDAFMPNNDEWLSALGYIPLLREVGTHFTINRMLTFDSVKLRLEREQPLTFLEFNYMILQSYDFRELNRRYGVTLQMGGSDQWGNIVAGAELVRRTDGKQVFGLTTPLITTASGAKMGKSVKGAVWLRADRFSPYEYWQFWRDTENDDVGRFLRLFTELPLAEIECLEARGGEEFNEAKEILAVEATALAHGRAMAERVSGGAKVIFASASLHGLGAASAYADVLPTVEVRRDELDAGIPVFRMFTRAGLTASNSEARRLIRSGGARINDAVVADEAQVVSLSDLQDGAIKLSAGRKQHRLVRVV
jgi:tyrosyl-tRNA synthetase